MGHAKRALFELGTPGVWRRRLLASSALLPKHQAAEGLLVGRLTPAERTLNITCVDGALVQDGASASPALPALACTRLRRQGGPT